MKVLITGPCGSGKTTLMEELEKRGYKTSLKVEKEFWFEGSPKERSDFERMILTKRLKIYDAIKNEPLVFFDRGVFDPIAYRKFLGQEIPEDYREIARTYRYDKVFITELLDSHEPNPERDHLIKNSEDAKKWYSFMLETLREFGYNPIIIKNMPVKERIAFVMQNL